MSLEDAAERCKVDANWLRWFVGKAGIRPELEYRNPTRRYYSLTAIRDAIRKERHGTTQ